MEDPHNPLDARPIQLVYSALVLVLCYQLNHHYHHKGKAAHSSTNSSAHLSSVRHTWPASKRVENRIYSGRVLSFPREGVKLTTGIPKRRSSWVRGVPLAFCSMIIVSGSQYCHCSIAFCF